jgi:transposase
MNSLFKESNSLEVSALRKRKKKKPSKPKFIEYSQHQVLLLPPSIEEMIPSNHIVRTVNQVIESMNIEPLVNTYKGGGRSSYNPMMLLKVLVYAYVMKIYSSRRIAKELRENVNFIWLSGMQRPDFRTLNNFRSSRLKKTIDEVFSSMIIFLSVNKYINMENYFVDGTKIDANANKYSYVWASNTKRYKEKTKVKIEELLREIERVNEEENKKYGDKDLEELGEEAEEITSEKLEEQIKKLNEIINKVEAPAADDNQPKVEQKKQQIKEKKKRKKQTRQQKALNELSKKYLPKLKKYEQQEKILNGRSSYSKTDKDATFFITKTDQLLPSYNVIIGTEEQLILNYSIHQKASETDKFIPHVEKLKRITGGLKPKRVSGDGAYGSEENYNYLDRENIEAHLKYSGFYQEQTGKTAKYNKLNFVYDEKRNKVYCPEERELNLHEVENRVTDNGFVQRYLKFRGNCQGCSAMEFCTKSEKGRTVQINKNLEAYKKAAKERLTSRLGVELRKKRSTDVETVFGDIKQNQGFRRFNLRGFEKVNSEFGLVAMAHNIKKIMKIIN